ncbi:MAG: EAL domain-containing protein [Methylocystaceae bacterium]|nr:EAL domain-containing protein [Methylocystaceae bacterium]
MSHCVKILLVEDSEDDAELLYLELRRGGLNVDITRVETAESFEDNLLKDGWDLVLSDYNLPTFNAPAALSILNQHDVDLPFIILSGAVVAKDAVALLRAGAHDFLEKNDLARLVPAIERELRDVKERRKRKNAENTLKKLFRAVEQSPITTMITDEKGCVEYVNPHYQKVTGFDRRAPIGSLPDILDGDFVSLDQNAQIWECVNTGREWRGEFCNHKKNGELFWEYVTVAPIKNQNGDLTNLLISKEDITFRKTAEEKIYRQANFDDLTKIPNRVLLLDRLSQALERSERAALITIDIDGFKKVNDSFGHHVGDQLLIEVARRLKQCLSTGETVGRVSGDEFALVIPEIMSINDVEIVISAVIEKFNAPFYLEDHELFASMSAGITIYPDDATDPSVLFRNAEAAMSKAKQEGFNGFQFFTSHMNARATERLLLEGELRKAINNDELVLYYQPIVDASTGEIGGAEALIRWQHPERGLIFPDEFIPLAEENGFIVSIGKWVLEKACEDIHIFQENIDEKFYVTINISPQQVWSGSLVNELRNAISENNVDPSALVIELTENVCLHDGDVTLESLLEIANMGILFAVDDFGTGYSSLSYLKKYPFKKLKIDRAFISDIPADKDDVALVDAMIAMAHSLGLQVIAEGVETQAHERFLIGRKCDLLQGYLYSRPIPINQFLEIQEKRFKTA